MKTRVIGIGNPLRQDDGAGPACVALLRQYPLPEDVEALDAGEAGLALVGLLADCDLAIVVDATRMGAPPGTVRRFGMDALRTGETELAEGVHARAGTALRMAKALGQLPSRVDLVGIEPESMGWGVGLSAVVERALIEALQTIQNLLVQHGVDLEKEFVKWRENEF